MNGKLIDVDALLGEIARYLAAVDAFRAAASRRGFPSPRLVGDLGRPSSAARPTLHGKRQGGEQ